MTVDMERARLKPTPVLTRVFYGDRVRTPKGLGTVRGTQRVTGEPLRILVALDEAPKDRNLGCRQVFAFRQEDLQRI